MTLTARFFLNSILLGIGLAMDAFSVSVANALNEPQMKKRKRLLIAGTFAFFQALMPMLGWFFIHAAAERFEVFRRFIPYIALILLLFIGGKMLIEGIRGQGEENTGVAVTAGALFIQGIATSIDALSVGLTISDYGWDEALIASLIIAAVTFVICVAGVSIGRRFGTRVSNKAPILGGIILIGIGLEIFIKGVFFS